MKNKSVSQSTLFNLRVLIGLAFRLAGVFLTALWRVLAGLDARRTSAGDHRRATGWATRF
jgi:hypothetical protein